MRVKYLKYGKTIRSASTTEHAEVSVEVGDGESSETIMTEAKRFIERSLSEKQSQALPPRPRASSADFNGA